MLSVTSVSVMGVTLEGCIRVLLGTKELLKVSGDACVSHDIGQEYLYIVAPKL